MLLLSLLFLAADLRFTPHPIATDLKGGYQVVVADMNHDGKPDLIALASGMPELVWFENPGWQRHVIVRGMTAMINLAVVGNAIVVADHFANNPSKSEGHVYLLEPAADPSAEWTKREIDRIPSSHRLRTMMLDGKPVVINAPLADPLAIPPDYRGHIPLVLYRPGVWKRETISTAEEGVMHGIFVADRDLYTASFLGIHAYRYQVGVGAPRDHERRSGGVAQIRVKRCGGGEALHGGDRALARDADGGLHRQAPRRGGCDVEGRPHHRPGGLRRRWA